MVEEQWERNQRPMTKNSETLRNNLGVERWLLGSNWTHSCALHSRWSPAFLKREEWLASTGHFWEASTAPFSWTHFWRKTNSKWRLWLKRKDNKEGLSEAGLWGSACDEMLKNRKRTYKVVKWIKVCDRENFKIA